MRSKLLPPAGALLAVLLSLTGAARAQAPSSKAPPGLPSAAAPARAPDPADTASARPGEEPYRLHADRLEGSATSEENVYTAIRVSVQHGTTTVTGDSARIYRGRELVLFRGNVKILDGGTVMLGDEASYDRKRRTATLRGNVRILEHGSRITGREARFYREENRSEIIGSPVMEDSTRTLRADRIEYDRTRDMVTAIGNVDAIDRAESTRVRAGRVRYDRRLNYAWAEDDPRLTIEESGGKSTLVRSTKFEMDNEKRRVYALGHVQVDRDKLRATGDRAEFYKEENRALLLGQPRAWDEEGRVQGDTLELRFAGNRVQSIQVRPNAVVDYESRADSTGRGERNHATGDTVTLHLEGDTARRAWVIGHARSEYWPGKADSAQGGRNVSMGDSILVEFDSGKPRRATVLGRSEGTYFMTAEGDTSAASQRERVNYQGDRIVYDVNQGTVDVEDHGKVVYKEMTLTADRVRFNSRTQRMRAEGKPVLQDGKDRITGVTMTYDLNRRQGTVYEGRTAYERGFYYGDQMRRVSENELAVRNGSYTTCDAATPHYHFGSTKMRILVHDKVIARPVVFYIKRIPVLALPFYVFPIKPGRHSGFELPQVQFGSSSATGKFIRNLGYYWAISDYLDATVWGDYYEQDRWLAHGQTRYHKRYRYQGQIDGSMERQFGNGDLGLPSAKQWNLAGTHFQTLGPRFTLTAQGTLVSSGTYFKDRFTGQPLAVRVQRNLHSSLSLQKSWSGASFETNIVRDQDLDPDPLGTRLNEQLPRIALSLTPRPLGHPSRGREPARLAWLASTVWGLRSSIISQRITQMRSHPDTDSVWVKAARGDSTLDVRISLGDSTTTVRTAARHDLSLSDTRTLFGFLRVSPGMSYSEVFYSRDAAGNLNQRAGVWTGTLGANTAVFGTFRTGLGPLRAIRHVITPAVSFQYQPAYPKLRFGGAYGDSAARFSGVGGISLDASEVRALAFSLRNDIHVKWGSASNPKVINNLIQLTSSGSFDLLAQRRADLVAQRTGVRPRVRALSNISSTMILRPLERSEFDFNFVHNPTDGKLLRMDVSSGFSLSGKSRGGGTEEAPEVEAGTEALRAQSSIWSPQGLTPSGLPWQFSLAVSYSGFADPIPGATYRPWQSSTRANGAFGMNPSQNWRVDYSYQYDLRTRQMISQSYSVKRDLHCWEMQFTRSVSGGQAEYYFKINVKNLSEVYYEQGSRGLRGFGGVSNLY